jgi:hypothetical protein
MENRIRIIMNRSLLALIILVTPFLFWRFAAADASPSPTAGTQSGIDGVISLSPSHPGPIREDVPSAMPLADAEFIVQEGERTVASFRTDDRGHFRVSLPPGHYTVSIKQRKPGIGRYGPFEAEVTPGRVTQVEWHCDTGMR